VQASQATLRCEGEVFPVTTITLALNNISMSVTIHLVSFQTIVAQVGSTGLVLIVNFAVNRIWTFQENTHAAT
jgi:putative flippase GtrA